MSWSEVSQSGKEFSKVAHYPNSRSSDEGYTLDGDGVWGGPGYYEDASGAPVVFYCGTGGHVTRLVFGAKQQIVESAKAAPVPQNGDSNGFTVATSSNLLAPDTGIVWLVDRPDHGKTPPDPNVRLFAFDADTLKKELAQVVCGSWTSSGTLGGMPWVTKGTFTDPTVADGRVFVGSDGLVTILEPRRAGQSEAAGWTHDGRIDMPSGCCCSPKRETLVSKADCPTCSMV